MLPINRLEQFKQLLSSNLLNLKTVHGQSVGNKMDEIISSLTSLNLTPDKQREMVIEAIDELISTIITDEVLVSAPNKNIQEKLLSSALAGFIDGMLQEQPTISVTSLLRNLLKTYRKNEFPNATDKIAFELSKLNFLNNTINDPVLQELMTGFTLDADMLGLNPFQIRKPILEDRIKHNNFHDMLSKFELTKGTINLKDQISKGTVPHRVHLIWDGSAPPEKYYENILSWKKLNPDYNVVVYTDYVNETESFRNFISWAKENKILVVDINEVIRFHDDYELFLDANNAKEIYGADYNNYGASSDIARDIILSLYEGMYGDIPDVRCIKPFPPKFHGNIFLNKHPEGYYNDYMIIGDDKGKATLNSALETIAITTITGWPSIAEGLPKKMVEDFAFKVPPRIREMNITVARTGSNPLHSAAQKKDTKPLLQFFQNLNTGVDSKTLNLNVESKNAATWVPAKNAQKNAENLQFKNISDKDSIQLIKAAITGILKDLRYYPEVINFDNYPIFQNNRAFSAALDFLNIYFPQQLAQVKNIVAYTTEPKVLLDHMHAFPHLSESFITRLCMTSSDPRYTEAQADYILRYIKENPMSRAELSPQGNNIFMTACIAGNFELAAKLATIMSDNQLLSVDANNNQAVAYCILLGEPDYISPGRDARIEIFEKLFKAGYVLDNKTAFEMLNSLITSGQFQLSNYLFNKLPTDAQVKFVEYFIKHQNVYLSDYQKILEKDKNLIDLNIDEDVNKRSKKDFTLFAENMLKNTWENLDNDIKKNSLAVFPDLEKKFQQNVYRAKP